MNYNMQGMTKTLAEVFAMLKTAKVEIKKEHTVLMVNKTTNFKKPGQKGKGKGKKSKRDGRLFPAPQRLPSLALSLALCASTAKGKGTGNATAPSTLKTSELAR